MSAGDFRADSRDCWEEAAAGWVASNEAFQRDTAPVSHWLVEAIRPQPGHTVLEVAAGTGEPGLLAAELVKPGGRVIITDGAEAMVRAARERARELGADNVDVRQMEAEWLDLPAASVDGVLCRWGYMLLADPEAGLREARRVVKPGGRLALAAWEPLERNPWMAVVRHALADRGLLELPDSDEPGQFHFSPPGRVEALLDAAGFDDIEVDGVDFTFTAPDLDGWWTAFTGRSRTLAPVLRGLAPAEHYALRDAIDAGYAPWVADDGSVRLPARALVAAASG